MISVGTIQEWWEISRRYPRLREEALSYNFLKTIGYCFILDQIEGLPGVQRILEFGHGFNPTIFAELGTKYEVHGIDDYQALNYFPAKDAWEARYSDYIAKFPQCHFHRGLLGEGKNALPTGYFDIVCSVSVLEELPQEVLAEVMQDSRRVLKPGGYLINSFDFMSNLPYLLENNLNNYLQLQARAGFDPEMPDQRRLNLYRKDLAIEDQRTVMFNYPDEPDLQRKWPDNWHTFLTKSKAVPANQLGGAVPRVTFRPPILRSWVKNLLGQWRFALGPYVKRWLGKPLTAQVKRWLGE